MIADPRKQQIPPLRYAPVGMTHHMARILDSRPECAIDAEYLKPVGGGVGEVIGWGVSEGGRL